MDTILNYFFNSPFLMFSIIISGAFFGTAARKISDDDNLGAGLFYFITKVGNVIGWLCVIGLSIVFSLTIQWYYFLIGIASIIVGIILTLIITYPLQWLSEKFASNYEAIWVIRSYFYYIFSIIFLLVGIKGLIHYCQSI